jgi:hypothetical protein
MIRSRGREVAARLFRLSGGTARSQSRKDSIAGASLRTIQHMQKLSQRHQSLAMRSCSLSAFQVMYDLSQTTVEQRIAIQMLEPEEEDGT